VAYLGEVLTDHLTKNQSLNFKIMEVFINIPREDLQRACSHFLFRLEEVIGIKGDCIRLKQSQYPRKQFGAVSLSCYSNLSCYHHFYCHLKTGVNTPRTLYSLKSSFLKFFSFILASVSYCFQIFASLVFIFTEFKKTCLNLTS